MATKVQRGQHRQFQNAFTDTWAVSDSFDFGSVDDGNEEVTAITVSGVNMGDMVLGVATSSSALDLNLVAQVTGTDTVEYQVENNTGGAINLSTATYTCFIGRPNW